MADNALKTPFPWYQNRFVKGKDADAQQSLGQGLPCHVTEVVSSGIVKVAFDVQSTYTLPTVTMAVNMPEYGRIPVQVGDKGVAIAAQAYTGGVTGLGGGTADLTKRGNLVPLSFQPLGNTAWFDVDRNAYVIYGPNGVVLQTMDRSVRLILTPDGIVITLPAGKKVQINGDLLVTGELTVGQTHFSTHQHSGVQAGGGNSGPPVPGS